ncbi:DciA family protein [Chelatococcus sp. SYSU_G07232]|uniref:DciA family protein n=1 Tax=Chelatococcus albus TaxID=3047466 RepID=A0ABT7AEM9_9HYPH|nr:DciA family protein [Chelatococcus sp. SYSU_G07232]MDJ1157832.1 DciA family protein [Chelatococcus sp. SYSU_G07232]
MAQRHLADLVDGCIAPALRAQGFAAADVVLAWAEIVGDRLARHTEPLRIDWPRHGRRTSPDERPEPATLVVRVTSAFALELQHLAPVIIERVNAHFGWRCIGRLALRQGPIERRAAPQEPLRSVDAATEAHIRDAVADIAEQPLREALERLGRAALAR